LLEHCCQVKVEDWEDRKILSCNEVFEDALKYADGYALNQLTVRREALSLINIEKLAQQKAKVERIYNNRENAAEAKVEAVKKILDHLSTSKDADVLKIVPVWVKNPENANRHLEQIKLMPIVVG
jgi:hypothetical protein